MGDLWRAEKGVWAPGRAEKGRAALASPGPRCFGKGLDLRRGKAATLQMKKNQHLETGLELVIGKSWGDTCKENRGLRCVYFFPFSSSSLPPFLSSLLFSLHEIFYVTRWPSDCCVRRCNHLQKYTLGQALWSHILVLKRCPLWVPYPLSLELPLWWLQKVSSVTPNLHLIILHLSNGFMTYLISRVWTFSRAETVCQCLWGDVSKPSPAPQVEDVALA